MASSIHVSAQPVEAQLAVVSDRWTGNSALVLFTCIMAFAFEVFEQTILQLATPLLIQEWQLTPATIGNITTVARSVGLIGALSFPVLADLYGRRPMLITSVLGYSVLTGLTGLAQNWQQLLVATSLTRIPISGETPVGQLMVAETAPTKWRATALSGLLGGYPFGYMLASLAALAIVPLGGWRALYFVGIVPGLLILLVRLGVKESPRFERVTTETFRAGMRHQFDLLAPARSHRREVVLGSLMVFFYLFTWVGWSTWMPQFLANEKQLGFQTAATYLSIWMFAAIFAYWLCGYLCDRFGRRYIIPAFVMPAAVLLMVLGGQNDATSLFIVGGIVNFLATGSFGAGMGYVSELFPTAIRGRGYGSAFFFGNLLSASSPAIVGYIATTQSIAAALPLLALSFFLLGLMFLFVAREMTGKELTDFVGQERPA
jgi:MFS family permease